MGSSVHLDLKPLRPEDIPEAESEAFDVFLNEYFELGLKLAESMPNWNQHSTKHDNTVQILNLTSSSSLNQIKKDLGGIKDYWCGRQSHHASQSSSAARHNGSEDLHHTPGSDEAGQSAAKVKRDSGSYTPAGLVRSLSHRFSRHSEDKPKVPVVNGGSHEVPNGSAVADDEVAATGGAEDTTRSETQRQAQVMSSNPSGIYERFRRGLLEYHSENEREYIESMRETECLHVYRKHVAEVWRLTYRTPPPTNPRTFIVLLLSRELKDSPRGERAFMNISIPFDHPGCKEKTGDEKSRVRGKYVSVERVRELNGGDVVEWRMATSSDAGGNIPRFVTNGSLPNSIAEDVPSFLGWMVKRFPDGGDVDSLPVGSRH
ncbi:hypothetical protein I317_02304 [Kwoniella heveanensis CBS 569]|nr:hypothetical protein I317_02304 [Kwoniella heveanensis CBS 569]